MIERFRKFYIEYLDYLDVNKNKNKINENMIKMNDSIDALNKRIDSFEELENLIDKYGVKYLQCPKDKCKELKTSIPQGNVHFTLLMLSSSGNLVDTLFPHVHCYHSC
ncbi:hypothetical protein KSF78_0008481 [Schistosoma japonicum]|nr:hypothetical protein KSF78_0008481 [Schistosoma japonicum]